MCEDACLSITETVAPFIEWCKARNERVRCHRDYVEVWNGSAGLLKVTESACAWS